MRGQGPGFGPGANNNGTVYDLHFPGLLIGGTRVESSNFQQTFRIGADCDPQSRWGADGNVGTITWGADT